MEDVMEIKKALRSAVSKLIEENGITVIISKPKDMTLDRYTILIARLEKIIDQLGGNLHAKSE